MQRNRLEIFTITHFGVQNDVKNDLKTIPIIIVDKINGQLILVPQHCFKNLNGFQPAKLLSDILS